MEVHAFFAQLAQKCAYGECDRCGAWEFCYTPPLCITGDMIDRMMEKMEILPGKDKEAL